jgi:hypothetical protein
MAPRRIHRAWPARLAADHSYGRLTLQRQTANRRDLPTGIYVAIEAADIILVKSNPNDVASIIDLARTTYRKMTQNLMWATGYNVVAIPAAAGVRKLGHRPRAGRRRGADVGEHGDLRPELAVAAPSLTHKQAPSFSNRRPQTA